MIKRRIWLILLPIAYVTTIGAVVAFFLPKKYEVKVTVNVLEARVDEPGRLNANAQQTSTQRELENAEQHVKQHNRVWEIIDSLAWQDFQQRTWNEKNEYIERIKKNIQVIVQPKIKDEGSTFIDITYKDTDPHRAETFLNALALRWLQEVSESEKVFQKEAAKKMRELVDEQEELWRMAEEAITELQKTHQISPLASDRSSIRFSSDPVEERLAMLEARRDDLLADKAGKLAARTQAQESYDAEPPVLEKSLPPVTGPIEKQLVTLKQNRAQIETKREALKPASREYTRLQHKLREIDETIETLEEEAAKATGSSTTVPNETRRELGTQLLTLDNQLLEIDTQLASTEEQIADVEVELQRRIDALARLRQLQSESEAALRKRDGHEAELMDIEENLAILDGYGDPYVVTQEALAEPDPSEPNVPLIIVFCLLGGIALGLALAALAEFARPGFRNASEAVRGLSVPVLGVVDRISTRSERVRGRLQRVLVGISTVVVLGGLVFVSWAWRNDPALLGTELAHALDELHEGLK